VFANIKQFLSSGETDTDLAKDLLEQAGVATIPGTCFGAGGHLRFTYACSENEIREGIEALRQFLDRRSA
jgi:aspartate/methionine/tyrosine aminotransferase